jgi:hypothetical protein
MDLQRFLLLFAACACLAAAQAQTEATAPPPPGVEEALRERVRPFYQAHMDEKYRKAYDVIADDSKDAFLTSNKPHFDGFDVQKVVFSDNYTKAVVTTRIHTTMMFFGVAAPEKSIEDSTWKIVDGQWYWYLAAATQEQSKYTLAQRVMMERLHMPLPGENPPAAVPGAAPALPPGAFPPGMPMGGAPGVPSLGGKSAGSDLLKQLRDQVKLDRNGVELRADQPGSAVLVVRNSSNGPVRIAVGGAGVPGLTVTVDKGDVPALGSATITITWKPGESPVVPPSTSYQVSVRPSGASLPFTVRFR